MSVNLSPLAGAGWQFFSDVGVPLSGGLIYTYAAGTTTPQSTFTTSAGNVANANPIVLDSAGRTPSEVWLTQGVSYKLVVKTASDVLIRTWDDIDGINDSTALDTFKADLANTVDVAKGDALVGFRQSTPVAAFAGAEGRTVHSKLAEFVSVWDFIPANEIAAIVGGTSTYDCTTAFNAAIATGKRVWVPNGTYSAADIDLPSGTEIEGESRTGVQLRTRTNGSGFFTFAASYNYRIKNLTAGVVAGVTDGRFIKQTDRTAYSAYAHFENIETRAEFVYSYDGFFIFTNWVDCRDGYIGTAGATHVFIRSVPDNSSQGTQTNICQVLRCQTFNATGSFGAVILEWGDVWTFRDTDFEANDTFAVQASGIFNLTFDGCWFEDNATPYVISAGNSTAPNVQGSTVNVSNCWYSGNAANQFFLYMSGAASGTVTNLNAAAVPSGCKLTNSASLSELYAVRGLSGAGASTFTTGIDAYRDNLVISASEMTTNVINSPQTQNQNMLPIGPSGLGASNFTNAGFTSLTDVASAIGLPTNALRLTLSVNSQAAYYTMPTKLLNFLKGKKVTLVAMGYASTYVGTGESLSLAAWDSIGVPSAANSTAAVGCVNISTSDELQMGYVTFTIGAGATSLNLGFFAGGDAATQTVSIESMKLVMGEIKPETSGLN